ncbi:hypothetical protein [Amycolatopsis japonica]
MIRDIYIAASAGAGESIAEPPAVELNVSVIGGHAHLARVDLDGNGNRVRAEAPVIVSARSLLLALRAAMDDDESAAG